MFTKTKVMTADQIDKLFQDTIQIKGIEKDAGVSKQVIYNYRNRPTLSMGDKIEFLLKLNLIKVELNEPTPKS